jgi:hypothetical protein
MIWRRGGRLLGGGRPRRWLACRGGRRLGEFHLQLGLERGRGYQKLSLQGAGSLFVVMLLLMRMGETLYQSSRRRRPLWTYASADSKLPCRFSKQNISKKVNRVVLKLGLVSAAADLILAIVLLYCSSAN